MNEEFLSIFSTDIDGFKSTDNLITNLKKINYLMGNEKKIDFKSKFKHIHKFRKPNQKVICRGYLTGQENKRYEPYLSFYLI